MPGPPASDLPQPRTLWHSIQGGILLPVRAELLATCNAGLQARIPSFFLWRPHLVLTVPASGHSGGGGVTPRQGNGSCSLPTTSQPGGSASLELPQGGPDDCPPSTVLGSMQVHRGLASTGSGPHLQEADGRGPTEWHHSFQGNSTPSASLRLQRCIFNLAGVSKMERTCS